MNIEHFHFCPEKMSFVLKINIGFSSSCMASFHKNLGNTELYCPDQVYNVKSFTIVYIAIIFSASFSVLIYEEGGEATKIVSCVCD